jgi:hypothetical protein
MATGTGPEAGTGMAARPSADPELGFIALSRGPGAALGALVLSLTLALALGGLHRWVSVDASVGLLCALVLAWSAWTGVTGAVVVVIYAALSADGFVVNHLGVLTWDGADVWRLGALAGAALLGLTLRPRPGQHRQGRRGEPSVKRPG